MTDFQLHEGAWMRKVLRGKKTVSILFIPIDPSQPIISYSQKYKNEEKSIWESFLALKPSDHVDIDAGLTVLRFKKDSASGTASFFPNSQAKQELHHSFEPAVDDQGNTIGLAEFNNCMDGKRASPNFNALKSFDECLSQLRVN